MQTNCISCGATLVGRIDKRFCNDNCRAQFHNQRGFARQKLVRATHRILLANRQILADLAGAYTEPIHRQLLIKRGFRFTYFTNELLQADGPPHRFCYDYGYTTVEPGWVLVLRREPCI